MACITPYIASISPQYTGQYNVPVRCGKCPDCLKVTRREWLFRIQQELRNAKSAFFGTFTYTDEAIPETTTGFRTLHYPDMQNFYKTVRQDQARNGLKDKLIHFTVGEYGEQTARPHYHAIILNANEDIMYKHWDKNGFSKYGSVTPQSIMYVLKYMDKADYDPYKEKTIETFWESQVVPPFRKMSQGIGKGFVLNEDGSLNNTGRKIRDNELYTVCLDDGTKLPLPRYYQKLVHKNTRQYKPSQRTKHVLEKEARQELRYYNGTDIYEEQNNIRNARVSRFKAVRRLKTREPIS